MSYRVEVIADATGEWCGNGLRFATASEAAWYASDLSFRWTAVRDTRIVESEGMVNARVVGNKMQHWARLDDGREGWRS